MKQDGSFGAAVGYETEGHAADLDARKHETSIRCDERHRFRGTTRQRRS